MSGIFVLQLLAIAGLATLLWMAVRAYADHRRSGDELLPASRPRIAVAALLALLVPVAMSWGFSVSVARSGSRTVREAEPRADGPARARVFLRAIQVAAKGERPTVTVGFSPTANLALPRHYGVAEAYQRRDLFRVSVTGKRQLGIEPLIGGDSDTRLSISSGKTLATSCRGKPVPATCTGESCAVVVCSGESPKSALVFRQELASAEVRAADVPLQVSPWVWSARGWRRHHLQLEAGELIQIGATVDALPGLTIWEVPAPSARPALMFPPDDLLGSCRDWVGIDGGSEAGFFYHPSLGGAVTEEPGADDDFSCFLPFQATQPFALEVRRLVPDARGVTTRSMWAGLFLAAPGLLWLLALFAARPSQRSPGRFAKAIAVAGWSSCLVAFAVIRLLWAHRLDMLRDYEAVGSRVIDNQLHVIFTGAALAASAALLAIGRRWRWPVAACAWSAMALLGIYAMAVDLPAVPRGRLAAYAAISIAVGAIPGLTFEARRWSERLRGEIQHRPRRLALGGMVVVTAVVAVVALAGGAPVVIVKIALAAAVVSGFYLCLRLTVITGDVSSSALVVVMAGLALALLASIDTGVATLYGGVGVVVALITSGFDALHGHGDRQKLDHYRSWLHPVVLTSSVLAIVVFAATSLLAAMPLGPRILPDPGTVTSAVLATLGLIPVLLAGMATLVGRRRGWLAAGPWLLAAAGSLIAWLARGGVISMVVGSQREAAKRIAAVVDPAYALLQDDAAFSRSLTAWREASLAGPDGPAQEVLSGQGFFGAQVLDPGVLLSIDNDYLPVLIVRELGTIGLALLVLLLVTALGLSLAVARSRLAFASAGARWRTVAAIVALVVIAYQPVASLGGLPFTGVSLLGLGIDSPSDWWVLVALLAFLTVWGLDQEPQPETGGESEDGDGPSLGQRLWPRAALLAGCLAVVASAARAGSFALSRPAPVEIAEPGGEGRAPQVEFSRGFEDLVHALDYAFKIQCPTETGVVKLASQAVPDALLTPESEHPGVQRFDRELHRVWNDQRAAGVAAIGRFLQSGVGECRGRAGRWRLQGDDLGGDRCTMRLEHGWPRVEIEVTRDDSQVVASCRVSVDEAVLRTLRYPVKRPFAGARIRLVSRPMGSAARDAAELVAGNVVLRLRPGAPAIDLSEARGGVYYASSAQLGEGLQVSIDDGKPVLARESRPGKRPATLLTYESDPTRIYAFEPDRARWQARALDGSEAPTHLERLSVIVTGAKRGRTVWLYRRATTWPGSGEQAAVAPLMADDVATVLGSNRRFYPYGGLVPELGWVNPWSDRKSLGLDGWVRAALSTYSQQPQRTDSGPSRHRRRWQRFADGFCPVTEPPPDDGFESVCAPSPLDGVLECRVSVQPELTIRLRHLLELVSLVPGKFVSDERLRPAIGASLAVIRGDTGEILAQAHFVAGREETAYAPATPSLEKYLIDAREDRDPRTGRRLAPEESGAEKVGWNRPVAVGSVLKPLIARAAERVDRDWLASLRMSTELRMKPCKNGVQPVLGYCPRTASVWNSPMAMADSTDFLGKSLNWFQAGLGIIATGLGGELGIDTSEVVQVGGLEAGSGISTVVGGREVLGPVGIDLNALSRAPYWRELEGLLGRRRCQLAGKRACTRRSARRDVCAARSLPIDVPSRDLRHLVALGPGSFDFLPEGRYQGGRVPVVEYLEFLRGSGAHPIGSILQVADSYARIFYSPVSGAHRLAASWFPVDSAGTLPASCSASPASPTVRGMCRALAAGGTASGLGKRLRELGVVAFGAKTGTIDSLGDIAESKAACERFNLNHTVPDQKEQPYHLECGKDRKQSVSDSLLVVGFGVKREAELVPVVLALRFQGVGGTGFATRVADLFAAEVADYLAPATGGVR